MRRAKTPLPQAISSTVSPGCKLSKRSLAGPMRMRWKSLPSPIRASQNEAFWSQMLRVSSFKSTGWEVFSAVIVCVFLSGRFSAWVERSVFERCNSFHTVATSTKVGHHAYLMLVLEARGKTHLLKRFGTIVYIANIQDSCIWNKSHIHECNMVIQHSQGEILLWLN